MEPIHPGDDVLVHRIHAVLSVISPLDRITEILDVCPLTCLKIKFYEQRLIS